MNRTVKLLVVGFAACTLLGSFFATHLYLLFNYVTNVPTTWVQVIRGQLVTWYLWGALAVLVIRLARRYSFDRNRLLVALLIHLPTAAFVSVLHLVLSETWAWAVGCVEPTFDAWWSGLRFLLLVSFPMAPTMPPRLRHQALCLSMFPRAMRRDRSSLSADGLIRLASACSLYGVIGHAQMAMRRRS